MGLPKITRDRYLGFVCKCSNIRSTGATQAETLANWRAGNKERNNLINLAEDAKENSVRKYLVALEEENEISSNLVFLGGTVNGSTWREKLISNLNIPYFNPIVKNWTSEDVVREAQAKTAANFSLYVITPRQIGFYVLVEMTVAATTELNKTVIITFLNNDDGEIFHDHQEASIAAIKNLLAIRPDIQFFDNLEDTADFLNKNVSP